MPSVQYNRVMPAFCKQLRGACHAVGMIACLLIASTAPLQPTLAQTTLAQTTVGQAGSIPTTPVQKSPVQKSPVQKSPDQKSSDRSDTDHAPTPPAASLPELDAFLRHMVTRDAMAGVPLYSPSAPQPNTPQPISLSPGATPAAGLLLLLAGKEFNQPKYLLAADQCASAILSSQLPDGGFPSITWTQSSESASADPQATVACIGFLLAMDHSKAVLSAATRPATNSPSPSSQATTSQASAASSPASATNRPYAYSATRAIEWLITSNHLDASWPPPPGELRQALKMDERSIRDLLLCSILADDVLHTPKTRQVLRASVNRLLDQRLGIQYPGNPMLWPTVLREPPSPLPPGTQVMDQVHNPAANQTPAIDVLASRMALQVLIHAYLSQGERSWGLAADQASTALLDLPHENSTWHRLYAAPVPSIPSTSPSTQSEQDAPSTAGQITEDIQVPEAFPTGEFQIQPTIHQVNSVKWLGRPRYLQMQSRAMAQDDLLAWMITGLPDSEELLTLPPTREEANTYLQKVTVEAYTPGESTDAPTPTLRIQKSSVLLLRSIARHILSPAQP